MRKILNLKISIIVEVYVFFCLLVELGTVCLLVAATGDNFIAIVCNESLNSDFICIFFYRCLKEISVTV